VVRLPLVPASEPLKRLIKRELITLGLI